MEVNASVKNLLEKPFSMRTLQEKLEVVRKGRPKPPLPNLVSEHKGKKDCYIRHFSISQYESVEWLTGCPDSNKLFCWPCLLFSREKSSWNKHGFSDLNHLSVGQQRHSKSQTHIQSFLQLKMFGKDRVDILLSEQHRSYISQHNEQVTRNREIVKRLIDAVCFLAKQELPFRGHNESDTSINKGNYLELLSVLKNYDPLLEAHFNTSTVFRGTSATIQNDLIRAVSEVVKESLKQEIKSADFVAIMLDETSDISCKSQLSTVLRYVHGGNVYERFVGFVDVSADRTANGLFAHVERTVGEFGLAEKLVGQTYDGASVMSGHINGLQSKVLSRYPMALFTHCYAHVLNLVLQQSISNIKACKIFFQTLSGLSSFFSKSSKRTCALQEFVQKRLPSLAPTRWNFSSRLVHTVKEHRGELLQFFESVLDNTDNWDSDAVVKSQGFLAFLNNFKTIFLLEIFSKLFSYTDVLYNLLQTRNYDVVYCSKNIKEISEQLQFDREHSFDIFWKSSMAQNCDTYCKQRVKRHHSDETEMDIYRRLYFEIVDHILCEIEQRFSSFDKLEFFHLLYSQNYENYKRKFPDHLLHKLSSIYGPMLDYVALKNELIVLYSSPEFSSKNVYEVVSLMNEHCLISGFSEVYKLSTLILTIPCSTSSVERSFSALRRINSYLRSTQSQERLSDLSLLSIEKQTLTILKSKPLFYDNVIEQFLVLSQDRRIELMYK